MECMFAPGMVRAYAFNVEVFEFPVGCLNVQGNLSGSLEEDRAPLARPHGNGQFFRAVPANFYTGKFIGTRRKDDFVARTCAANGRVECLDGINKFCACCGGDSENHCR